MDSTPSKSKDHWKKESPSENETQEDDPNLRSEKCQKTFKEDSTTSTSYGKFSNNHQNI